MNKLNSSEAERSAYGSEDGVSVLHSGYLATTRFPFFSFSGFACSV